MIIRIGALQMRWINPHSLQTSARGKFRKENFQLHHFFLQKHFSNLHSAVSSRQSSVGSLQLAIKNSSAFLYGTSRASALQLLRKATLRIRRVTLRKIPNLSFLTSKTLLKSNICTLYSDIISVPSWYPLCSFVVNHLIVGSRQLAVGSRTSHRSLSRLSTKLLKPK